MTDLDAQTVREWLTADAIDCLQEWLTRTGDAEVDSPTHRVRWMADGTTHVEVETPDTIVTHRYRVSVLVEPAGDVWSMDTWRGVAYLMSPPLAAGNVRVRLGGQEATVASAVIQRWHIDPRSNEYRPEALEHEVIRVKLEGRDQAYDMKPDGQVEVWVPPVGPAVANLLQYFPGSTPVEHTS